MIELLERNMLTYENIEPLALLEDIIGNDTKEQTKTIAYQPPLRINRFFKRYESDYLKKLRAAAFHPIGFLLAIESINRNVPIEDIKAMCKNMEQYTLGDILEIITTYQKNKSQTA